MKSFKEDIFKAITYSSREALKRELLWIYNHCIEERIFVSGRSESNPFLTKICLYYDKYEDIEIRVNIYGDKSYSYQENLHDHKWSFISTILRGDLTHTIYKRDFKSNFISDVNHLVCGDTYKLTAGQIHTVVPSNDLITILIRGPRVFESWAMYDQQGSKLNFESKSDSKSIILSDREVECLIENLPPIS